MHRCILHTHSGLPLLRHLILNLFILVQFLRFRQFIAVPQHALPRLVLDFHLQHFVEFGIAGDLERAVEAGVGGALGVLLGVLCRSFLGLRGLVEFGGLAVEGAFQLRAFFLVLEFV